eukprot:364034-Chlamydomonas_euryale.AAC.16
MVSSALHETCRMQAPTGFGVLAAWRGTLSFCILYLMIICVDVSSCVLNTVPAVPITTRCVDAFPSFIACTAVRRSFRCQHCVALSRRRFLRTRT